MAVMGLLAGRLAPDDRPGEKDFTQYDALSGLREAQAFFAACRTAGQRPPEP